MIVRFDRLYVWHEYDPAGNRIGINLADIAVLEDGSSGVEVAPKPFAGAPISNPTEVERRLRRFNPRYHFIAIIVYRDSFKSFGHLKKMLVDKSFEYRLMPTDVGEVIRDRGGAGGVVQ